MAKVLLVEDDNNLREIYQARLMAEGYDIVTAQNGEDALVVAKQSKPDLIISDVMMPRISGFEMLDILRNTAELKHTKVIMLTALGQAEDQARADSLGADKYLVKSQVTLEDIVNTAKELLDDGSSTTSMTEPALAAPEPVAAAPVQDTPAPVTAPAPAPAVPTTPVAEPAAPVATVPTPEPAPSAVPTPQSQPAPVAEPVIPTPTPVTPVAEQPAPTAPIAEPAMPPAPEPAAPASTVITPVNMDPPAAPVEPAAPEPVDEPMVTAPLPSDSSGAVVSPTGPANDAVSDSVPQSLEAEEAALQAQIDSFAKAPAPAPTPVTPVAEQPAPTAPIAEPAMPPAPEPAAPVTSAPTPEPIAPPTVIAPEPAPVAQPAADEAANDATIKSAVDDLNKSVSAAPTPLQPPSVTAAASAIPVHETPEPAAPAEPVAPPIVAGKKVISPITPAGGTPDLNALLAKEEAKEPVAPVSPAATVTPAPTPAAPTTPPTMATPPAPGQSIDPNTVAL